MAIWTQEENTLLKELYPNHTIDELAPHFNHSRPGIFRQALKLRLKKTPDELYRSHRIVKHGRAWQVEEIELLKELSSQGLTGKEIAKRLDRTPVPVKGMRQRLGLKISYPPPETAIPGVLEKSRSMTWQYLAGFIDGDGSLVIASTRSNRRREKHLSPWLLICNTNTLLMESIHRFLYDNVNSYKYSRYKPVVYDSAKKRRDNEKPIYTIRIAQKDVLRDILLHIQPYLVAKEKQARVMLDFLRTENKEIALYLRQEMCSLNKRGRLSD